MDEFKKAHRKMFKNGFVETENQEEENKEVGEKKVEVKMEPVTVKEKKKAPSPPPRVDVSLWISFVSILIISNFLEASSVTRLHAFDPCS